MRKNMKEYEKIICPHCKEIVNRDLDVGMYFYCPNCHKLILVPEAKKVLK